MVVSYSLCVTFNSQNSCEVAGAETSAAGNSPFVDEAECLRRVPVSRRTWYSWRVTGKIPTVNVGGRRNIFHWPSVEAALLRMQRGGGL